MRAYQDYYQALQNIFVMHLDYSPKSH